MQSASIAISIGLLFLGNIAAQTTPPLVGGEGQFAAYHEAADREMGEMLRNVVTAPVVREPEARSPSLAPTASVQPQPTAAVAPQIEISEQPALAAFAGRFWNGRLEDLRVALRRMTGIRPTLERILAEEGVPPRFAAVVLVESGANPEALSPKAARGLWQFVPETARRYGLLVSERRDDRIDLLKSTRAAARYLRDLYRTFGDWQLALAAYNAGEGALQQAVRRGGSLNFQLLSDRELIPAETRSYVPAVLAAVNLLGAQRPSSMAWMVADSTAEVRP
jgi:soluble lytic murein transglycosylase-like protein